MKLNAFNKHKGWIEAICGPMCAGKSEELLRRINRFKYADISYLLFKPKLDTRSKGSVKSRDGRVINAIEITSSMDIINHLKSEKECDRTYDAIAIDEAQFLDEDLGAVCDSLANKGYVVYVAGLDLDFRGEPFKPISSVLSYADIVTKLTAICTICGADANRTQRLINGKPAKYDDPLIVVGDTDAYEARCRAHHEIIGKKKVIK